MVIGPFYFIFSVPHLFHSLSHSLLGDKSHTFLVQWDHFVFFVFRFYFFIFILLYIPTIFLTTCFPATSNCGESPILTFSLCIFSLCQGINFYYVNKDHAYFLYPSPYVFKYRELGSRGDHVLFSWSWYGCVFWQSGKRFIKVCLGQQMWLVKLKFDRFSFSHVKCNAVFS